MARARPIRSGVGLVAPGEDQLRGSGRQPHLTLGCRPPCLCNCGGEEPAAADRDRRQPPPARALDAEKPTETGCQEQSVPLQRLSPSAACPAISIRPVVGEARELPPVVDRAASHVQELLETDYTELGNLAAVEFVNMMSAVNRFPEGARILGTLPPRATSGRSPFAGSSPTPQGRSWQACHQVGRGHRNPISMDAKRWSTCATYSADSADQRPTDPRA
jgi:hypothetical protein